MDDYNILLPYTDFSIETSYNPLIEISETLKIPKTSHVFHFLFFFLIFHHNLLTAEFYENFTLFVMLSRVVFLSRRMSIYEKFGDSQITMRQQVVRRANTKFLLSKFLPTAFMYEYTYVLYKEAYGAQLFSSTYSYVLIMPSI